MHVYSAIQLCDSILSVLVFQLFLSYFFLVFCFCIYIFLFFEYLQRLKLESS